MTPKEQHDDQELCNAQEREQSQSQLAEMNSVQVAAHRARHNNRERGRAQQLGNDNRERRTLYDCERRQSQIAEMTPAQLTAHRAKRNNRESGTAQQLGNEIHEQCTQNEAF